MSSLVRTPEEILDRYWERGCLPINPITIARRIGIVVEKLHGEEAKAYCGVFLPGNEKYHDKLIIKYNVNDPITRQRFTVAHELAHYFLGHGKSFRSKSSEHFDTPQNFDANVYNLNEIDANSFAFGLIMPINYVYHFFGIRMF